MFLYFVCCHCSKTSGVAKKRQIPQAIKATVCEMDRTYACGIELCQWDLQKDDNSKS